MGLFLPCRALASTFSSAQGPLNPTSSSAHFPAVVSAPSLDPGTSPLCSITGVSHPFHPRNFVRFPHSLPQPARPASTNVGQPPNHTPPPKGNILVSTLFLALHPKKQKPFPFPQQQQNTSQTFATCLVAIHLSTKN